jgi:hypothetical protein
VEIGGAAGSTNAKGPLVRMCLLKHLHKAGIDLRRVARRLLLIDWAPSRQLAPVRPLAALNSAFLLLRARTASLCPPPSSPSHSAVRYPPARRHRLHRHASNAAPPMCSSRATPLPPVLVTNQHSLLPWCCCPWRFLTTAETQWLGGSLRLRSPFSRPSPLLREDCQITAHSVVGSPPDAPGGGVRWAGGQNGRGAGRCGGASQWRKWCA